MNIINATKKPIIVQAVKTPNAHIPMLNDSTALNKTWVAIKEWCYGSINASDTPTGVSLYVTTLEGDMRVNPGDYVICGIKGEFYPCKPDIFEATYDIA